MDIFLLCIPKSCLWIHFQESIDFLSTVVQQKHHLSVIPTFSTKPNSFVNASNTFGEGHDVFGLSPNNKSAYCH